MVIKFRLSSCAADLDMPFLNFLL